MSSIRTLKSFLAVARLGSFAAAAQEIGLTDRYLEIQRVRFPDRLHVERDIPLDVQDALVPSLVLQPLVENAVLHGVARQVEGGRITLRARRIGSDLELQVCDSGPGFTAGNGREGIGLSNTRARLAQLYGEAQRVTCVNGEMGACVSIVLPYHAAVVMKEAERLADLRALGPAAGMAWSATRARKCRSRPARWPGCR